MHLVAHAIVKTTDGKYLFQLRDKKQGIHRPGVIGFFGGSAEGTESALEAVVRELREELSLVVDPKDVKEVWHTTHLDPDERQTLWHIFLVCDVDASAMSLHEGAAILHLSFEEVLNQPLVPDEVKRGLREHEKSLRIGF